MKLYGYCDEQGWVVIKAQYEHATEFYEGVAMVHQKGKWQIIDTSGNVLNCETGKNADVDYSRVRFTSFSDNRYVITDAEGTILFESELNPACFLKAYGLYNYAIVYD